MENQQLEQKYQTILEALQTIQEAMYLLEESKKYSQFQVSCQDSLIQRFEYTIDGFWKLLKLYLQEREKVSIDVSSPRSVLQKALDGGILQKICMIFF